MKLVYTNYNYDNYFCIWINCNKILILYYLYNLGKRHTIIKVLKENLLSNRKSLNSSLILNYPYVAVPLETGITLPGHKRNCTPAGMYNYNRMF